MPYDDKKFDFADNDDINRTEDQTNKGKRKNSHNVSIGDSDPLAFIEEEEEDSPPLK